MSSSSDSTDSATALGTPTQKLRDQLSAFRFKEELTPSLRRSPRNHTRFVKNEEEDSSLPALDSKGASTVLPSKKRARTLSEEEIGDKSLKGAGLKKMRTASVPAKKRKGTSGIAPPEKYAHLEALSDHLGEGADALDG